MKQLQYWIDLLQPNVSQTQGLWYLAYQLPPCDYFNSSTTTRIPWVTVLFYPHTLGFRVALK